MADRTSNDVTGIKGVRFDPLTRQPLMVENEADHFYICAECGQAVDKRELGEVFHHEDEGHGPLLVS